MNLEVALTGMFFHIADLNHDKTIDMKDVGITGKALDSYPEHPRWNPTAAVHKIRTATPQIAHNFRLLLNLSHSDFFFRTQHYSIRRIPYALWKHCSLNIPRLRLVKTVEDSA